MAIVPKVGLSDANIKSGNANAASMDNHAIRLRFFQRSILVKLYALNPSLKRFPF